MLVYSRDLHDPALARLWDELLGIRVQSFTKGELTHIQTLSLFEVSIMHIWISKSDGIPPSTLEAMRGGANPIKSNTECLEDWIFNGKMGT